jgi:hypothetical protein
MAARSTTVPTRQKERKRPDEKLTALMELEAAILQLRSVNTFAPAFQLLADFHISQTTARELINNVLFTPLASR